MLLFLTIASGLSLSRHVIELFGDEELENAKQETVEDKQAKSEPGQPGKYSMGSMTLYKDSVRDESSGSESSFEDVPFFQHSTSSGSLSDADDDLPTPPLTPLGSCPFSQLVLHFDQKVVDSSHQDLNEGKQEYRDTEWWRFDKGNKVYLDVRAWDVAKDRQIQAEFKGLFYTSEPTWSEWGLNVLDYLSWASIWIVAVDYCLRSTCCSWGTSSEGLGNLWSLLILLRIATIYSFVLVGPLLAVGFP